MEFIEGEKNFNKILCRLSAIMHLDDPRYLDLTFDRTVEQRKKYRQDIEAAKAAAETLSSAAAAASSSNSPSTNDVVDDLDPKELDREVEATIKKDNMDIVEEDGTTAVATAAADIEGDVDVEAQEVVRKVKELILVRFIVVYY